MNTTKKPEKHQNKLWHTPPSGNYDIPPPVENNRKGGPVENNNKKLDSPKESQ
jgi:hypothetical protein